MKKTISLILAIIILICSAMPISANILAGDADSNGSVDTADSVVLSRYLANWSGYSAIINLANCILDTIEEVSSSDSVILARHLAKWSGYMTLPVDIKYKTPYELGIPALEKYSTGTRSRCAQDIAYFNGKLYVGNGDASANVGPITIYAYDPEKDSWSASGTVADEEVSRFRVIGGKLVTTGVDPTEGWEYGNYYSLNESTGGWDKIRTIPNAIHNFDMLEHDGLIFAGIAVSPGNGYPIAVSSDGGKSFKQVDMIKDGALRDISERQIIRVYELFLLNDTVYALFRYQSTTAVTVELYRYEDGRFVYDNYWGSKIDAPSHIKYMVGASAEFKGRLFFTTAYLYATSDMNELTWYEKLEGTICDLCVANDKLYVLSYTKKDDGSYRMTVYENTDGSDDGFNEAFYFDYSAPAISFDYGSEGFYFGVGDINNINDKNGMVLKVEYTE